MRAFGGKGGSLRVLMSGMKGAQLRGPVLENHEIEVYLFLKVIGNRVPQSGE